MEANKKFKISKGRMGIKIFSDFINRKNEANESYYYECLAAVSEFSPYDMMILKRDLDDWGSYSTTYHEIKMRDENISINDYDTSVVDASKITTLQKIAYQTNNRTFINVIYPKNRIICQWEIKADTEFDSTNKEVKWQSESINKKQEVKLAKLLVELPINQAKKYRY